LNRLRRDFKGKRCAYCSKAVATSEDHVFARQFFLKKDRSQAFGRDLPSTSWTVQDPPKAPACHDCNSRKSQLETYLTAVLPFAGRHAQAVQNLTTGVPKRLDKNRKVSLELFGWMKAAWLRENGGIYQRTSVVDFDGDKLIDLLKYVGRGLAWHHSRPPLTADFVPAATVYPARKLEAGLAFVDERRAVMAWVHQIGGGTGCRRRSVWRRWDRRARAEFCGR
jgi:hypothetical protein